MKVVRPFCLAPTAQPIRVWRVCDVIKLPCVRGNDWKEDFVSEKRRLSNVDGNSPYGLCGRKATVNSKLNTLT